MPASTTPALYAIKLVEVLRQAGVDCLQMLQQAGFTARELADREQEISIAKYLQLVESAVRDCELEDLGFLVGEHTGTLEHGVMGYALLSSATLAESLQRYTRYQGLVGPLLNVSLDVEGEVARMSARPVNNPATLSRELSRYFIQEWLATWNPWSGFIGIEGAFFSDASIALPDDRLAALYEKHLGCPVRFTQGVTSVCFPASHLALELQHTNETIGALCHEQCELLLEAQQLEHGLTAEIHRRLARRPGNLPNMEEVATDLNMTSRTLRRHLKKENTRFQDVVITHRIAMAKRYLSETSLPANEIAALVGYADQANFYRTFRSLAGVTPQIFRALDPPGKLQ